MVGADQLTKLFITQWLSPYESSPEEGILRFTFITNRGGIWGTMQNAGILLTIVSIVWVVILFIYSRWLINIGKSTGISLGLLLGGTIGNLIDRVRFGYVIDFIDIKVWGAFHWPIFNIADSCLSVGVTLLIIYIVLNYKALETSLKNNKVEY